MARFPFHKSLESFDFKFQPSIDPKVVRELATGRFIADADNVLLLGPPGVGKTHLAVGLGLKACAQGYRTAFTTASGLITTLTRAHQENRIEEKLKQLVQPKLLIIDEIGYLPLDRLGANLFFQLVSRRYERGAILITSNQSLTGWARSSVTRSSPRRFWIVFDSARLRRAARGPWSLRSLAKPRMWPATLR